VQIELLRRHRARDTAPEVVQGIISASTALRGPAQQRLTRPHSEDHRYAISLIFLWPDIFYDAGKRREYMTLRARSHWHRAGNGIGRAPRSLRRPRRQGRHRRSRATARRDGRHVRQKGGEALFVQADVTDAQSVQAYVKKARRYLGPHRLLPHNAASAGGHIADYDEAMFDQIME